MNEKGGMLRATIVVLLVASITVIAGPASPASATQLGYCDFNADGFSDLPVGVPNADENARNDGRVDVWTGAAPFNLFYNIGNTFTFTTPENGTKLGQSLLCEDLDADGYDDLIVGSPFQNGGGVKDSGAVNIAFGGPNRFDGRVQTLVPSTPNVKARTEEAGLFGWELSAGDYNADGVWDLAVSQPGASVKGKSAAGKVHIFYGRAGIGIIDSNGRAGRNDVVHQASSGIKGRPDHQDFFGLVLTTADFDGDGFHDLAVGVPYEDVGPHTNAGAINVIFGNGNGLSTRDQVLHRDKRSIRGEAATGEYFGYVMRTEQLIGRGRNSCFTQGVFCRYELIVGVPGQDVAGVRDAGAIHILRGTNRGLSGTKGEVWHRGSRGIADSPGTGDEFGYALAFGFFNNDGFMDVAIGVPGDDKGRQNTGSVHFIFGDGDGLSRSDRILHQSQPGFDGKGRRSDRMGMTFAAGDYDGDGLSDLAVGVPLRDVGAKENAGMVLMVRGGALSGNGSFNMTSATLRDFAGFTADRKDNYGSFSFPLIPFGGFRAITSLEEGVGDGVLSPSRAEEAGEFGARSADS